MKETQYNAIKEHVPAIDNYPKEVQLTEQFCIEKGIAVEQTAVVFWNHIITLLERIDEDDQNSTEQTPAEEMSKQAQELTGDYVDFMNSHRPFDITAFEKYLITIHFEQLK
ncbi:hypothetical protein ACS127_00850 [Amphibacillus sp. Q70]|uniref:hypothetical protein n=1 Tax=Amphibacillus sp. Q70 TaxID=3453416 RepID=UPI003F841096